MKIKDILAGVRSRPNRQERKRRLHRAKDDNLYTVHATDLNEADARIQHIEDLVLWHGTNGAKKSISTLKKLESSPSSATIKWDGSPAVIFGRNENGEFVLTDKSGFGAKGYDGKVTSKEAMAKMFLGRGKTAPDENRKAFVKNMENVWDVYERATPSDFRGYVHGDLLYYTTPELKDGAYEFTPNTTMYKVKANSDVGKKIAGSKAAVVLHAYMDLDGNTQSVDASKFNSGELLVMPPAVVTQAPDIKNEHLSELEAKINKYSSDIDKLLNVPAELKMKDFATILYTYINNKTKAGTLDTLGKDFAEWVSSSKLSAPKQQRVVQWVSENNQGFAALFSIVSQIMQIKNEIIDELDNQPADIEAYTSGKRGGEGYVVDRDVKLVNRTSFTQANMARTR